MALVDVWKNPVNVIYDAAIPALKKPTGAGTGWQAGAISRLYVPTPQACGMSWVTRETDKAKMCGLSANVDTNQSYEDIDLAWFAIGDGTLQIYEGGVLKYDLPVRPTYSAGDILEIQLEYVEENAVIFDDFNDNSIDSSKWVTLNPSPNGSVIEQNGRLEVRAEPNDTIYSNAVSAPINLQGKTLTVDIAGQSGLNYAYHENYFQIIKSSTEKFFLYFGGGSGLARIYDNGTYYQASFGGSYITKFRFRHDAVTGDLKLDVFNSNTLTWQNVLTRPALTYSLDSATHLQIDAGMYSNYGIQPYFAVDNIRITDTGTGFVAQYYHTPFGGSRVLRYTSDRDVSVLFPNLRIDSSIYHEGGTIENVQTIGDGWIDEKGFTKIPDRVTTIQQFDVKTSGIYLGGGGVIVPPVTTGQIYPRGIK